MSNPPTPALWSGAAPLSGPSSRGSAPTHTRAVEGSFNVFCGGVLVGHCYVEEDGNGTVEHHAIGSGLYPDSQLQIKERAEPWPSKASFFAAMVKLEDRHGTTMRYIKCTVDEGNLP